MPHGTGSRELRAKELGKSVYCDRRVDDPADTDRTAPGLTTVTGLPFPHVSGSARQWTHASGRRASGPALGWSTLDSRRGGGHGTFWPTS
jgi:hypothetical protein